MAKNRCFNKIVYLLSVLVFSSVSLAQNPSNVNWRMRESDEIAPGFLIRLSSVDDKKLNGEYRVDFDGILKLPYGVRVDTSGMSERSLDSEVINKYRGYFKSTPNVDTAVVEKRYWVDVRGLVQKAGKYLVGENSSLDEIISKAGALRTTDGGKVQFVKIQQLGVSATLRLSDYYRGLSDELIPNWQGGEIIFFQSEGAAGTPISPVSEENLQLLGQVAAPGEYRMKPGTDFLYYLVKAGGPTERADLDHIEIIRIDPIKGKRQSIQFTLEDVNKIPTLKGGDIIMLHPVREDRSIMNFTAILTSIASVALLFLV